MGAPPPTHTHSLHRHGHSTGSEGHRDSSDLGKAEDTGTKKEASFPRGKASSQSRSQRTRRVLSGPGRGRGLKPSEVAQGQGGTGPDH